MPHMQGPEAVLAARIEVLAAGERFVAAAIPILTAAIRRRLEAVVASRGAELDAEARTALFEAADRALGSGIDGVAERLSDPDVWLSPRVRLEEPVSGQDSWGTRILDRFSATLKRGSSRPTQPSVGDLATPLNRVWIAILSAAKSVDPVLKEFGFDPSAAPDPGGGHFGLQPRTLTELDPSGHLARLWRGYRDALGRYETLLEEASGGSARPTA